MISIEAEPTAEAIEDPCIQGHRLPMSTGATGLTRRGRIDGPNLGHDHAIIMRDGKTRLGERETIVSITASKARVSWGVTSLHSTEKRLESQVNTYSHILQDLGMNAFKGGSLLFEYRQALDLVIQGKPFAFLFPTLTAFLKQMVIEPATFFQNSTQLAGLLFGWVYPILKHFKHAHILVQSRTYVEDWVSLCPSPEARNVPSIPMLESRGFTARFDKCNCTGLLAASGGSPIKV